MGKEVLVEGRIDDALELVKRLDKRGLSPTSAFWNYYSDADEWRLVIAGPPYDPLLSKDEALAYQKIAEAMAEPSAPALGSVTIADVKLVKTDDVFVQVIRRLVRTPQTGLVKAHFLNTRINSVFVEEMMVLRAA
jgi:hypothetical protein